MKNDWLASLAAFARIVGRRAAFSLLTLWVVFTVTFFLMRALPGGPFASEQRRPPIIEQNLKAKWGFDQPLWRQYVSYLGDVFLRFDFRTSMKLEDFTVNDVIAQTFPISASIGICALSLATLVGVSAGVLASIRRGRVLDWSMMGLATIGVAAPSFVLGSLALIVFVFQLGWLPAGGWGTIQQLILPACVLAAPFAANIARLTRTGMLEVLNLDYIRTAHAKGLSEAAVVYVHALRGALLPVISFLGPATAGVLTGSLVLESLFNIQGMGRAFVDAANLKDYTMISGMTMIYALVLVVMNNLVDVAYAVVDPRVKLE